MFQEDEFTWVSHPVLGIASPGQGTKQAIIQARTILDLCYVICDLTYKYEILHIHTFTYPKVQGTVWGPQVVTSQSFSILKCKIWNTLILKPYFLFPFFMFFFVVNWNHFIAMGTLFCFIEIMETYCKQSAMNDRTPRSLVMPYCCCCIPLPRPFPIDKGRSLAKIPISTMKL